MDASTSFASVLAILWRWVQDNPSTAASAAIVILTWIANASMKYTTSSFVGVVVHKLIDVLSPLARKDSPQTLKLPFTASLPPLMFATPGSAGSLEVRGGGGVH